MNQYEYRKGHIVRHLQGDERTINLSELLALANRAEQELHELRHRRWRCGWLARKGSMWVGVHYSPGNKRWCINLIPCVTLWITKPGGTVP